MNMFQNLMGVIFGLALGVMVCLIMQERETKTLHIYETDCFDHTRGQWLPDSNRVWKKLRK